MSQQASSTSKQSPAPAQKLLNKSFYRFLFSFIAVIAGVLLFVLVLGVSDGSQ